MQTLYKITNSSNLTKYNTLWGPNVTHTAKGKENRLCTDGVIHAYSSPELAVVFNPIHCGFNRFRLWKAQGNVIISDDTKVGCKSLTTIEEIQIPDISATSKIAFGILCVLEISKNKKYVEWANKWLSGKDRTTKSAILLHNEIYKPFIDPMTNSIYDHFYNYSHIFSLLSTYVFPFFVDAAYAAEYTSEIKKLDLQALIEKAMTIS